MATSFPTNVAALFSLPDRSCKKTIKLCLADSGQGVKAAALVRASQMSSWAVPRIIVNEYDTLFYLVGLVFRLEQSQESSTWPKHLSKGSLRSSRSLVS